MKVAQPLTVGDLKALIADLPDDMPLHRRQGSGEYPLGIELAVLQIAPAKNEPNYFADVKNDQIWSQPKNRVSFGEAVDSLCVI